MIEYATAIATAAGAAAAAMGLPPEAVPEWAGTVTTGLGGTGAAIALYYALNHRLTDLRGELDDVQRSVDSTAARVDAVADRMDLVTDRLGAIGERLSRIEGALDAARDRDRVRDG